MAVTAHELPERVAVAVIIGGVGPAASEDFPELPMLDKFLYWSTNNTPWLGRTVVKISRIMTFSDPAGTFELFMASGESERDKTFGRDFREKFGPNLVEALRQGIDGWTHDLALEGFPWPFELEEIHTPTVLVFHGEKDEMVPVEVGVYVCRRIPACDEPMIYPDGGHSVAYYRYGEIIQAMFEAWK